jgi:hypothetical protein
VRVRLDSSIVVELRKLRYWLQADSRHAADCNVFEAHEPRGHEIWCHLSAWPSPAGYELGSLATARLELFTDALRNTDAALESTLTRAFLQASFAPTDIYFANRHAHKNVFRESTCPQKRLGTSVSALVAIRSPVDTNGRTGGIICFTVKSANDPVQ